MADADARLSVLVRQLAAADLSDHSGLAMVATSGHGHAAPEPPTYSIALPERLTPEGPWCVFRCVVRSARKAHANSRRRTKANVPPMPLWCTGSLPACRACCCMSAYGGRSPQHPVPDRNPLSPPLRLCARHARSVHAWWRCRAATSPFKLVSTFAPPADHVRTLHDNIEFASSQYPNVRRAPTPKPGEGRVPHIVRPGIAGNQPIGIGRLQGPSRDFPLMRAP